MSPNQNPHSLSFLKTYSRRDMKLSTDIHQPNVKDMKVTLIGPFREEYCFQVRNNGRTRAWRVIGI